eukprot:maker-scaffold938_size78735-snap-gene-0.15 protein:Tk04673 transcript:maker-scaffold938_size78735-snap-gene-0.15-mRNA-1 annotation:"PREDICTED: uncharacterized protein LOC103511797"
METWRAFHSQDGPGGLRNALGPQVLLPAILRGSQGQSLQELSHPYAANTLVDNEIAMWNKFPALREASTKRMASNHGLEPTCNCLFLPSPCNNWLCAGAKIQDIGCSSSGQTIFPNGACNGTGNVAGTCYTDQECQTRNGMAMGTCASGYGVCCVFTILCGQTSSENCTIFNDNTAPNTGVCTGTICPISANICQLRLDFLAFQITGPVTVSTPITNILNGAPVVAGGVPNSAVGQCATDMFQVTSGSANNPP